MVGLIWLCWAGAMRPFLRCLAAPACRYCRAGNCPGWRGFCPFDAGYRFVVGKTDVGRMVGLGCPPDFNVDPVLFLSWLYRLGQWV